VYPSGLQRLHPLVALGVVVLLLVAQQVLVVPGSGHLVNGAQNAAHGPWFAVVTMLLARLVRRRFGARGTVAVTALIGIVVAAGSEMLQAFTGRDAELSDVGFDLVGMCAALTAWSAREKLIGASPGYLVATLLLLGSMWPGIDVLLIERYRHSIAPDLVRFDSAFSRDLVVTYTPVEIGAAPAAWRVAEPVLKIVLPDGDWPGLGVNFPIPDWRPYSKLVADLYVDGATALRMGVAVRIDNAPVEHVDRGFECGPGPCHVEVPLEDLFDRTTARVNLVVFWCDGPAPGRVLYVRSVGLRV
jgi:hypothetical protein